ncbi:MAG: molybdopterin-dependent oxidoreductase [Chloroflexota bacterium]
MINLTINGQSIEAPEGATVLQAAEAAGITIPTLCYHKDLTPFGGCRLCVVEVEGARLPATACNLPVSPGLVVHTDTPAIVRYRQSVLRMMLSNFYDAGYKRSDGGFDIDMDSEFAHWAQVYEVDIRSHMAKRPHEPVDSDPNPFVWVDMNKCIQCTRCVRACAEVQGRFVWTQAYRGYQARIVAGADTTMLQARCESCGACVAYCPTGALDNKMSVNLGRADRLVQTTCAYCGVGCQFDLNVKDDVPGGRVLRVTSNPAAPVNGMHLCLKGRYGYDFIHHFNRLTKPRVRQYLLDGAPRPKDLGKWVEVDWDTALDIAAKGLQHASQEYGAQGVGLLASGKCLNEENYLVNKLARQVLGTHNVDCGAHLAHASLVDGLEDSLGLPAMSNSFDDIEGSSRALLVIGSNLTEQHPVFGARLRQAILRRKVKMVVAYPDFINIAEYAALQLQHRTGSEAALLNGLMYIILEKGWEDRSFIEKRTQGFAEFKAAIDQYPPERVAALTGVAVEALYQAAEMLATNRPMAVLWSVGIAGSSASQGAARDIVHNLANLQMLLGNLDLPGGGVNPLGGQNNIQGAGDMGCRPQFYPGYQPVTDESARRKFERAWGRAQPNQPGLTAPEMLAASSAGQIKALYVLGEDLVSSSLDSVSVRASLQACDFIVLQAAAASEMDRYADVILPGVSFAEKSGTFTNVERRIQMVRQAIRPMGEARPDWQIITALAHRLLAEGAASGDFAAWQYADTAQILTEIAALSPIYAGVSHERLEHAERLQWPVEASGQEGTPILHIQMAKMIPVEHAPSDEALQAV